MQSLQPKRYPKAATGQSLRSWRPGMRCSCGERFCMPATNDDRPIVCVDLDGVLNLFDGWKSADYFHEPRPGAAEFLKCLNEMGYRIVVFTVRWATHVE